MDVEFRCHQSEEAIWFEKKQNLTDKSDIPYEQKKNTKYSFWH